MKIHQYNEMMRWLTRPKQDPSIKQLASSNPLGFPEHMIHEYEGGQLKPEEFYQWQSIPQSERPLTGAEGGRVYDTKKYLQGGRVGLKPGGLVDPGVMYYGKARFDDPDGGIKAGDELGEGIQQYGRNKPEGYYFRKGSSEKKRLTGKKPLYTTAHSHNEIKT